MARPVKRTAMRATKKAMGSWMMRVRAMRAMAETSPRDEGDGGHNNHRGDKAATTATTVVRITARVIKTAARVTVTEAKWVTGQQR
jgi:hypothetical protein